MVYICINGNHVDIKESDWVKDEYGNYYCDIRLRSTNFNNTVNNIQCAFMDRNNYNCFNVDYYIISEQEMKLISTHPFCCKMYYDFKKVVSVVNNVKNDKSSYKNQIVEILNNASNNLSISEFDEFLDSSECFIRGYKG